MLYKPEFILILWLFPVTLMVILPLFLSGIGGIQRVFRRKETYVTLSNATREHSPEKRKLVRIPVEGVTAVLQYKNETCRGTITNISSLGVCIKNIPHLLFEETDRLKIWLQKKDQQVEMLLRPKWEKVSGSGKMIGAEIINPSKQWIDSFATGNHGLLQVAAS